MTEPNGTPNGVVVVELAASPSTQSINGTDLWEGDPEDILNLEGKSWIYRLFRGGLTPYDRASMRKRQLEFLRRVFVVVVVGIWAIFLIIDFHEKTQKPDLSSEYNALKKMTIPSMYFCAGSLFGGGAMWLPLTRFSPEQPNASLPLCRILRHNGDEENVTAIYELRNFGEDCLSSVRTPAVNDGVEDCLFFNLAQKLYFKDKLDKLALFFVFTYNPAAGVFPNTTVLPYVLSGMFEEDGAEKKSDDELMRMRLNYSPISIVPQSGNLLYFTRSEYRKLDESEPDVQFDVTTSAVQLSGGSDPTCPARLPNGACSFFILAVIQTRSFTVLRLNESPPSLLKLFSNIGGALSLASFMGFLVLIALTRLIFKRRTQHIYPLIRDAALWLYREQEDLKEKMHPKLP